MNLTILSNGNLRAVYADDFNFSSLGSASVRRASHVEPNEQGDWIADLSPVGGPRLGPFHRRADAIRAETDWLNCNINHLQTNPMTNEKLLNEYLVTIDHELKKYRKRQGCDDLRQELVVMVLKSDDDPDLDNRAALEKKIQLKIKRFFADDKKHVESKDIDIHNEGDDGELSGTLTRNDVRRGELSDLDKIYLRLDVDQFIESLTPRQQQICRLLQLITASDVVSHSKYSQTTLARELQKIRELAKNHFEKFSE